MIKPFLVSNVPYPLLYAAAAGLEVGFPGPVFEAQLNEPVNVLLRCRRPVVRLLKLPCQEPCKLRCSLISLVLEDLLRKRIAFNALGYSPKTINLFHGRFKAVQRNINVQLIQLALNPPDALSLSININEEARPVLGSAFTEAFKQVLLLEYAQISSSVIINRVISLASFFSFGLQILAQVLCSLPE